LTLRCFEVWWLLRMVCGINTCIHPYTLELTYIMRYLPSLQMTPIKSHYHKSGCVRSCCLFQRNTGVALYIFGFESASTVFSKGIGIPMVSVRPGSMQLTTVTHMNTLECSRSRETSLRVRKIDLDGRRCTPTRTLCCTVDRGSYMYGLRYEPDNSRRLSTYVHVHVLCLEGLLES
jgi:hypothetical protein